MRVCLCLGVRWCARGRRNMENVLILHVFGVLCVSSCMHGGGSHTECCSPVSAIRGPHKHGARGESGGGGNGRALREREGGEGGESSKSTRPGGGHTQYFSLALPLSHSHTHTLRRHTPKGTVRSFKPSPNLMPLSKFQFQFHTHTHAHFTLSLLSNPRRRPFTSVRVCVHGASRVRVSVFDERFP